LAKISRNIFKLKIAHLGVMCIAIVRFQEERGNMFELENEYADHEYEVDLSNPLP